MRFITRWFALNDDYDHIPLVVTENGMACPDEVEVGPDGVKMVHDDDRIDYLRRHLEAVHRAIEEGGECHRILRVVADG